jgi:hypothetical protein
MRDFLHRNPRCFHIASNKLFDVLAIDWEAKTVKVTSLVINGSDSQEILPNTYDFKDVLILAQTGKPDDTGRELVEGDIIEYGDHYKGVVTWNSSKLAWDVVGLGKNGIERLGDILSEYIHVVGNTYGRSVNG